MAKTRTPKKGTRKTARRTTARRITARGKTTRRKTTTRRTTTKRTTSPKPAARTIRANTITHTELASADPMATRTWCTTVLGWEFGESMPTPGGPYHMWRFPNETGGGIRANNPPETPGSIPYCEVTDIRATFEKALAAGATECMGPTPLPEGMGFIAIVTAPGGVMIGFWSMK